MMEAMIVAIGKANGTGLLTMTPLVVIAVVGVWVHWMLRRGR
jgi:hypothetical protein